MMDDSGQPAPDPQPEPVPRQARPYGFFKRLKLVTVSALITSLFWGGGIVLYWPRAEQTAAVLVEAHPSQIISPPKAAPSESFDAPAVYIPPPEGLKLPVQGVLPNQLTDTYSQARGEGTRVHNALDIIAPRSTPVIAAAAGTVVKLFLSKDGGNTVYVRSPDGNAIYYYAHLDGYAPGLAEGMAVTPGEALGYVGSTGDADPAAPHLHFAIMALAPGENWWQGQPVNPYPLLGGR